MTALEKVCVALGQARLRFAIVGGQAVALHGAVRGTVDIDVAIVWSRRSLERAETALNDIGLVSRIPVSAKEIFEFRDEYIKNRNLVAWNFYNPIDLSEQVDIIIAYDLKGKRTKQIRLANALVPILGLKDLIDMKRRSGRPQDIEDVRALETLH